MKVYKGFKEGLVSKNGFQYEEGKEYEIEGEVAVYNSGFHASEHPLQALRHYKPNDSIYHVAELSGQIKTGKGPLPITIAGRKIRVEQAIPLTEMAHMAVEHTRNINAPWTNTNVELGYEVTAQIRTTNGLAQTEGNHSTAIANGSKGAAVAKGASSVAVVDNYYSAAETTGNWSVAVANDDWCAATADGTCSVAAVLGDGSIAAVKNTNGISAVTASLSAAMASEKESIAAATNFSSLACAAGKSSVAVTTGTKGRASAEHPDALAVAWGYNARAKGVKGSWLVLTDWDDPNCGAKIVQVDGETVKENTWYGLKEGELYEES